MNIYDIARKHADAAADNKRRMREAQTERYRTLREHGLCVRCKEPVTDGACMCPTCREAHNKAQLAKCRAKSAKLSGQEES